MARYCSKRCFNKARCARQMQRSRASWKQVLERDGPECWLCQADVDLTVDFPHPNYPSVDHVIPKADGGADDMSNYRLAHFLCNARRGRTPAALYAPHLLAVA